jgi:hypothetical protein
MELNFDFLCLGEENSTILPENVRQTYDSIQWDDQGQPASNQFLINPHTDEELSRGKLNYIVFQE